MQRITLALIGSLLLLGLNTFSQSEATLESSIQLNITNIKTAQDLDTNKRLMTFDLQLSTVGGGWSSIALTARTYSKPRAGSNEISQLVLCSKKINNTDDAQSNYEGFFLFSVEDFCRFDDRVLLGIDLEVFGLSGDHERVFREMKSFHLDRSICD